MVMQSWRHAVPVVAEFMARERRWRHHVACARSLVLVLANTRDTRLLGCVALFNFMPIRLGNVSVRMAHLFQFDVVPRLLATRHAPPEVSRVAVPILCQFDLAMFLCAWSTCFNSTYYLDC